MLWNLTPVLYQAVQGLFIMPSAKIRLTYELYVLKDKLYNLSNINPVKKYIGNKHRKLTLYASCFPCFTAYYIQSITS